MISYQEALEIINSASPLEPTKSAVQNATGHILRETIVSDAALPPFRNSAMDGFAVRADTISTATENIPIILDVVGSNAAGEPPQAGAHGCWEIMTGAVVPAEFDSVVKIEDVEVLERDAQAQPVKISFTKPCVKGANIRLAGEDIQIGEQITTAGTLLTPYHIMTLASLGYESIMTTRRPKINIFSTGKEVIDCNRTPLKPGQIRNSNAPYLLSALSNLAVETNYKGVIRDEADVFEQELEKTLPDSDVIISTGAVSAGRFDFVPSSLEKLGAEILFHKVYIRPGKPVLYARFPNGTHYFGLPGNPVSAAIGLRFFCIPLINKLNGQKAETELTVKLVNDAKKPAKFRAFYKAEIYVDARGQLCATILDGQESFKIKPLMQANGWVILPEGQSEFSTGEMVTALAHDVSGIFLKPQPNSLNHNLKKAS